MPSADKTVQDWYGIAIKPIILYQFDSINIEIALDQLQENRKSMPST